MTSRGTSLFLRHPQRMVAYPGGEFALPLHVHECDMHIISGTVDYVLLKQIVKPHGVDPVRLSMKDGRERSSVFAGEFPVAARAIFGSALPGARELAHAGPISGDRYGAGSVGLP